jgi:hypothetical protein
MDQVAQVLYYRCDHIPLTMEMVSSGAMIEGMTSYHGHIYTTSDGQVLLGGDLFEYLPLTTGYQHREVSLRLAQ